MKFKVWDNRDKCFVENSKCGNLLKSEFFYLNHVGELFYHNPTFFDQHGPEKCGEGEYTPVYSTGKTDKNGVELFDGDKIKTIHSRNDLNGKVFYIYFDNQYLQWGVIDKKGDKDYPHFIAFMNDIFEIEKIGSKFENPELLEKS